MSPHGPVSESTPCPIWNLVRVAMVLGRGKELDDLFQPRLETLDDILRYENSAKRQRIKRKPGNA
jgi:hypothetical protein